MVTPIGSTGPRPRPRFTPVGDPGCFRLSESCAYRCSTRRGQCPSDPAAGLSARLKILARELYLSAAAGATDSRSAPLCLSRRRMTLPCNRCWTARPSWPTWGGSDEALGGLRATHSAEFVPPPRPITCWG